MLNTEMHVELEGRTFIIKKMPAAKSYALLVDILTKALPFDLIGTALEQFVPGYLLRSAGKRVMSAEDFEKLQYRILSCVSEVLPAFPVQVVDENGTFGVKDLEFNMLLFGELLAKSLEFQYKDFFLAALETQGITLEDPEKFKTEAMSILSNATGM